VDHHRIPPIQSSERELRRRGAGEHRRVLFHAILPPLRYRPNGAISLLNADGIMLARSRDDEGTHIGRDMSKSPLFRTLHDRPAASVYYFKSPLDGLQRLSFYQLSSRYPIGSGDAQRRLDPDLGLLAVAGVIDDPCLFGFAVLQIRARDLTRIAPDRSKARAPEDLRGSPRLLVAKPGFCLRVP
jgi:hypothetical protein